MVEHLTAEGRVDLAKGWEYVENWGRLVKGINLQLQDDYVLRISCII